MGVFIEVFGFLPRKVDLEWMARAHGFQLTIDTAELLSVSVSRVRQRFADRGRWCPPTLPRGWQPPEWQARGEGSAVLADLAVRYPRKRHRGQGWTIEELRVAITTAYDAMPPGQRLTFYRYNDVRHEHGLPSMKTLYKVAGQHGLSFAQLVKDEAARRASDTPVSRQRR